MLNMSIHFRKLASIILAKEIDEKIFVFLKENKNPSDVQVHTFAEKENINVHDLERAIYKLATKYVESTLKERGNIDFRKDFWEVGEFNKKNVDASNADSQELKMGIKVEMEHTSNPKIARRIALDHLIGEGISDYYTRLKKMEDEVRK